MKDRSLSAKLAEYPQSFQLHLRGRNARKLKSLAPGCRSGDNANAFLGGFRLWEDVKK